MVLKAKNAVLPIVGAAIALQAVSCKKDKNDNGNTDLLVGEWEIIVLDGDTLSEDYKLTFEFQADKDFQLCSFYTGLSYCYNGGWKWANSNDDEVDMNWEDAAGDEYFANLKIETINADQITGDFTTPDTVTYDIVLEKID